MSGTEDRVRDTRRARITDNISFTDIPSVGNTISAYVKDPRRATVSGRQGADLSSQYLPTAAVDNLESGPASSHSQSVASKAFRRLHHSKHPSSSLETLQTISSDSRASGVVPTSYSSQHIQSSIRPLSISQKPPTTAVTSDKIRSRKDNAKVVSTGDGRHLKQTLAGYPLRGASGGELLPMSEMEKGGFALAEGKPQLTGPIASANWEHMQREVEHLRRTVQEFHKVSRKQAKVRDNIVGRG